MNSWDKLYLKWRQETQDRALSPKIFVSAGGINTKKGLMPKIRHLFGASSGYNTPAQAKKIVKKFKNQNIPMTGHLTPTANLEDLYSSGQSQLAHVEEITKATMREFGGRGYIFYDNVEAYLSYLIKNADSIAMKLKENNIVVSSALSVIESIPQARL